MAITATNDKPASARQTTFAMLDRLKPGDRFNGIEITLRVKEVTGVLIYPDTVLRYVREYRRTTGRIIVNMNRRKSMYRIVR